MSKLKNAQVAVHVNEVLNLKRTLNSKSEKQTIPLINLVAIT